jgi:hypothetical protein
MLWVSIMKVHDVDLFFLLFTVWKQGGFLFHAILETIQYKCMKLTTLFLNLENKSLSCIPKLPLSFLTLYSKVLCRKLFPNSIHVNSITLFTNLINEILVFLVYFDRRIIINLQIIILLEFYHWTHKIYLCNLTPLKINMKVVGCANAHYTQ